MEGDRRPVSAPAQRRTVARKPRKASPSATTIARSGKFRPHGRKSQPAARYREVQAIYQVLTGSFCNSLRTAPQLNPQSFPQARLPFPCPCGTPPPAAAAARPVACRRDRRQQHDVDRRPDTCGMRAGPSTGRNRSPPGSPAGRCARPARRRRAAAAAAAGRGPGALGEDHDLPVLRAPRSAGRAAGAHRRRAAGRSTAIMPVARISAPNSGMRSSSCFST